MGYFHADDIEKAGRYLLSVLRVEGTVHYSRFFNGTDDTEQAIVDGMGFDEDECPDCPVFLIDLAAYQLENEGFVKLAMLDDELCDGEQDYQIELTTKG